MPIYTSIQINAYTHTYIHIAPSKNTLKCYKFHYATGLRLCEKYRCDA